MVDLSAITAGFPATQTADSVLDLLTYQRDCSVVRPGCAAAMVRPATREDVVTVMRRAHAARIPVYVRGGGTMYAGGVNPHAGGVVLDLSGLDRILDIDTRRGVVIVEPGVRFGTLSKALQPLGLTVGIIPSTGPTATVGGAASAHALGTGSARFQSFADEVVGLEVVLPGGDVVRTGSAAAPDAGFFTRYCIGPDLTGLFLGADASLGVATAIALWLHPLPSYRETRCFGLPSAAAAAEFIGAMQARELTRHVWYGAGYDAPAVRGRVLAAQPATDPAALPPYCVGLDFGGEEALVRHDRQAIGELATAVGGFDFPVFNEVYFRRLRNEEIYWYGFAGYFARSRCTIVMASLPTARLPDFLQVVERQRGGAEALTWGAAAVICRRGLHGGVLAFYDEASQWTDAEVATARLADQLLEIGAVPYKCGKLWAPQVRGFSAYHGLLGRLKATLDPHGIMSPGNLGLGMPRE